MERYKCSEIEFHAYCAAARWQNCAAHRDDQEPSERSEEGSTSGRGREEEDKQEYSPFLTASFSVHLL
jgi:hypothetical protein